MGRLSLPAVLPLAVSLAVGVAAVGSPERASAQGDAGPVAASEVMLDDVGPGFVVVDDVPGSTGSHTRTFRSDVGELQIMGFAVTDPPGVRTMFEAFASGTDGLEAIDEPSLELGVWLVDEGDTPGVGRFAALSFAARDHLFTMFWIINEGVQMDSVSFLLDLARRQIDAAGGPPAALDPEVAAQTAEHEELFRFLPDAPPAEHGTGFAAMSVAGADDLDTAGFDVPEVAEFLNVRAKNVVRVWASDRLVVAVGLTQYPYDIFAAAGLETAGEGMTPIEIPADRARDLPDAVAYRIADANDVGIVFRRGDMLVIVLADWIGSATESEATALALDMAAETWQRLPGGGTGPYQFPDPPSRVAGILLTAGFVTLTVAGSRMIAWLRARRVRRRWATGTTVPWASPGAAPGSVVQLDADADALRRRGRTVAVGQLLCINVGVVALSGDFGWPGVVVAVVSLVAGLAFTRWWLQRELALLGPAAPRKAFVVPRLSGVVAGIFAFAVLGVGVAAMLRGLRYIILKPTLAQLRWADRFGVAPRTAGVVFAVAGVVFVAIGAVLYRLARSLGRSRVGEALMADPRPPALYLRSFSDDRLQLPIIASANRPLFELFSTRGASPFEEAVAWELNTYAPVVAVGRPGGSLRSLGAAREHLPNDSWHDQVAGRMAAAAVIALAPGDTAGLAWELRQIVTKGHLAKTVFVFPPLQPAELERRWQYTSDVLAECGVAVGALPAPVAAVHTVRIDDTHALRVTTAARRDEATYRTAVDRALEAHLLPTSAAPPPPILMANPSAVVP